MIKMYSGYNITWYFFRQKWRFRESMCPIYYNLSLGHLRQRRSNHLLNMVAQFSRKDCFGNSSELNIVPPGMILDLIANSSSSALLCASIYQFIVRHCKIPHFVFHMVYSVSQVLYIPSDV